MAKVKREKIVKLINESPNFNLRILHSGEERQIVHSDNVATITIKNKFGSVQNFGFLLTDIYDFEVFEKELDVSIDEVLDGCAFTVSLVHPVRGYIYKEKEQSKKYTEMLEFRYLLRDNLADIWNW